MNPKYQVGGEFYQTIAAQYGRPAADYVAAAAGTGDVARLNAALSDLKTAARTGRPVSEVAAELDSLDTSTASIFATQVSENVLSAPLDWLNSQLGKAAWNVVKNPFVLAIVAGVVWWKFFRKK